MAFKRKRQAGAPEPAPAPQDSAGDSSVSDDEQRIDPSIAYSALLASMKSKSSANVKRERELQKKDSKEQRTEQPVEGSDEDDDEDNPSIQTETITAEDEENVNPGVIDTFKLHLEHHLTHEEITNLDSGKQKLKTEGAALGVPKAKWITTAENLPDAEAKLSKYSIKVRLRTHWENMCKKKFGDFASEQQCQFFALCNSYRDICHTRKASLIGKKGSSEIMDAYLLHIINHILKTKDLVTKNNDRFHRQEAGSVIDIPRDQGFTRPKVLILLPMRNTALKLVKRLLELSPPLQKTMVEHKQRFLDDFSLEDEDPELVKKAQKPPDYESLFNGNNDDHFRIGIKFTRKSINLYSDYLSSDIILASPLGLVTSIGEAEADKGKNVDYLSSIEILVIDFVDVILMQNWSHVTSIFEHLNKMPSQQHDVDIMRIREWYLNGQACYFRQTIFLSPYPDAAINAIFLRSCVNHSGKVKLQCRYDGVLSSVLLQVRQVYEGLNCESIRDVDDARFEFFAKQIFPRIKESLQTGILLFVRSYFDFVRLRNFLKAEDASFCLLGEYTKGSDISRSRTWFFHGKRRIMLYTERAHFYHRFRIRGIQELIFYSLPDHANFYAEITNMLEGVQNPSCTVLYSKFDNLQLERIVGSSRAQKLLSSKETMMFL